MSDCKIDPAAIPFRSCARGTNGCTIKHPSYYELESALAAEQEARKKAEAKAADFYDKWDNMRNLAESANAENARYKQRAEAARSQAMIADTKAGQTNPDAVQLAAQYWSELVAQNAKIEELERRERMLVEALNRSFKYLCDAGVGLEGQELREYVAKTINATPSHSEAWEWNQHVEWMKKQGSMTHVIVKNEDVRRGSIDSICKLKTPLYAIPELKEVKE